MADNLQERLRALRDRAHSRGAAPSAGNHEMWKALVELCELLQEARLLHPASETVKRERLAQTRHWMRMTFAEKLASEGDQSQLPTRIRDGSDNSTGARAAVKAMEATVAMCADVVARLDCGDHCARELVQMLGDE